jgi:3D (Asp-Asp-Asp) domain-containing protein
VRYTCAARANGAAGGTATAMKRVAAFGTSCYVTSDETADFRDASGTCKTLRIGGTSFTGSSINPTGLMGTFCKSFLAFVRLNGSGRASNGQLIQLRNSGSSLDSTTFAVTAMIKSADGTPVVAGQTVARDRTILGRGGRISLDGIGQNLLANDIGNGILGYRIDRYMGFGSKTCVGVPNQIVMGACGPSTDVCPGLD